MGHRVSNSQAQYTFSRPIGLDRKTWKCIEPIFKALQQAQQEAGRFRFYRYLAAVYRTYQKWKDRGISKRMARHLAMHLHIPLRKRTSPVRTLIDATFPDLDSKRKSRWSRALEFAALKKTLPKDLPKLFRERSGIAGCARQATKRKPKKDVYRNDWLDRIREHIRDQ
jgi:hypothetical protein